VKSRKWGGFSHKRDAESGREPRRRGQKGKGRRVSLQERRRAERQRAVKGTGQREREI
jgi:hypothetical protein